MGTKQVASPPVQKVGGHVPLSAHGSMPMAVYIFRTSTLYSYVKVKVTGAKMRYASVTIRRLRKRQSCQLFCGRTYTC